jgi:hypothetical protein
MKIVEDKELKNHFIERFWEVLVTRLQKKPFEKFCEKSSPLAKKEKLGGWLSKCGTVNYLIGVFGTSFLIIIFGLFMLLCEVRPLWLCFFVFYVGAFVGFIGVVFVIFAFCFRTVNSPLSPVPAQLVKELNSKTNTT